MKDGWAFMQLVIVMLFGVLIGYVAGHRLSTTVEQQGPCPEVRGNIKVTVDEGGPRVITFNVQGRPIEGEPQSVYIGMERKKPVDGDVITYWQGKKP